MQTKKTVLKVLGILLVLVFAAFFAACEKDPPEEEYDEIVMIQVPGGSFQMGKELNPSSGYSDETPVHTVTLTGFYMSKTEVTQGQYQAVMGSNPASTSSCGVGGNYPVYYVSWYDALVFCNKLSMKEGLMPAYRINNSTDPEVWGDVPVYENNYANKEAWDAVEVVSVSTGYRLPTEAQWEYAAKGGNGSPGNFTYSGSNNAGDVAWYGDNSGNSTHPVGTKAVNGLGLYDMSGNVWEWCWDASGSVRVVRVVRGGSWINSAQGIRSAYRYFNDPDDRYGYLGFRLVLNSNMSEGGGGGGTHDIDSSLYGTWSTSNNALTVTFSSGGVTWGGTVGNALNIQGATWIAKNGNISYSYSGTSNTAFTYTMSSGNLVLTSSGTSTQYTLSKS